jgi:Spy/CpxP family protein refolding chaperone
MKHAKLFLVLLTALAALGINGYAQDAPPPEDGQHDERPEGRRPNLLAELGLSPDQMQQIRRLNQERRPKMMDARRRMGEAARNLDVAIYGDVVSDAEFQVRLKEFQSAEAELSRVRFEGELSVRKILTPEQLIRFRELRRRFAEERQNEMRNRRRRHGGRGMRPRVD